MNLTNFTYDFLVCNSGCITNIECVNQCESYIKSQSLYYLWFLYSYHLILIFINSDYLIKIENVIERKFNYKIRINLKKIFINYIKTTSLLIVIFELYKLFFGGTI